MIALTSAVTGKASDKRIRDGVDYQNKQTRADHQRQGCQAPDIPCNFNRCAAPVQPPPQAAIGTASINKIAGAEA